MLASPAVFHIQLLGTMHMLPCFIVMYYPLTVDHVLSKDAPKCVVCLVTFTLLNLKTTD